jgi:hypothetical protein
MNNALVLENITDETIEWLIAEHIKNSTPENYNVVLIPFDRGVYIKAVGKLIISNCCGDISDIANWKNIFFNHNTR